MLVDEFNFLGGMFFLEGDRSIVFVELCLDTSSLNMVFFYCAGYFPSISYSFGWCSDVKPVAFILYSFVSIFIDSDWNPFTNSIY